MGAIDPRISVIEKRLNGIKRIIAFSSAKGGVGKSVCSSVGALILANRGYKVGLLDLDFQGSSDYLILGETIHLPSEKHGIIPLKLESGINFMSFSVFSGNNPVTFRGNDATNALIELLSVIIWEELDYLIIDMPPGMGEQILDIMRFVKKVEFLLISTGSLVSLGVVERLIRLLTEQKRKIVGIVENMARGASDSNVKRLAETFEIDFLGSISFDPSLEISLGKSNLLLSSAFANDLERIVNSM